MNKRPLTLIKVSDVKRGMKIQCWMGDPEFTVKDIYTLGNQGILLVGGEGHRRRMMEEGEVRLVRSPANDWILTGLADEGETYFEGATVECDNVHSAYALLMTWQVNHTADEDWIEAVVVVHSPEQFEAIVVFTVGCRLVLTRDRAGRE